MNIIFEGIDAVGKSTLINNLKLHFDKENINARVIKEIEESPLNEILSKMLKEDPFFNSKIDFKTSIYETFLLAADFFYKQEYFREESKFINIYDRDFFTVLCYQKLIIEKEYGERANEFFESFTNCLMFDLKNIDLFVYMKVPLELSFKRIEDRDNYILNDEQKKYLKKAKERFENELIPRLKSQNINIIEVDGQESLEHKIQYILKRMKNEKIKHIGR